MRLNQTDLLPLAATVAAMFAPAVTGQGTIQATPYGAPSECKPGGDGALGLYLVEGEQPAMRLEGGTPGEFALVIFAGEPAETQLPGGGTLLVGPTVARAYGQFDEHGVFARPLDASWFEGTDGELFVQGAQPMTSRGRGTELSGGLQLIRVSMTATPPPPTGTPEVPEEILVEELADMMRAGHLEAALDLALNSKDDALTFDINAHLEVPVFTGITAGGKAAFKASVKRGEDGVGAVVYDLAIGADVAAAAGVGAGVAGAGASSGAGAELVWRFDSTHQVARALRSMIILQAVADQVEAAAIAIDTQLDKIDRAVDSTRRAADRLRRAMRSRMLWANNPIVQRLQQRQDELRAQRRELADRARQNVAWLISWIADARIFLITHQHGYEIRQTMAIDASVGVGLGDAEDGGEVTGANLGASLGAAIERQMVLRAEFVPESDAVRFERKFIFTKSVTGNAGFGVGASAAGKRVIELSTRLQMGTDGLQTTDSGTTVRLTLDGKLLGALGMIVSGQAGVGGEVSLELRLADLLGYSRDAIQILLGDDDQKVAEMLLAFPIKFCARGRYEAGIAVGVGVSIDGAFKGSIGTSLTMVDCGQSFEYAGGSGCETDRGETVPQMLVEALRGNLMRGDDAGLQSRLSDVTDEVTRVLQQ